MTDFDTIFADPTTTAAYLYGVGLCVVILMGWGLLMTFRAPAVRWTPELRAAFQRR